MCFVIDKYSTHQKKIKKVARKNTICVIKAKQTRRALKTTITQIKTHRNYGRSYGNPQRMG